jgi:hypothetical protein
MASIHDDECWSDSAEAFWLYGPQGRVLLVFDRNGGPDDQDCWRVFERTETVPEDWGQIFEAPDRAAAEQWTRSYLLADAGEVLNLAPGDVAARDTL